MFKKRTKLILITGAVGAFLIVIFFSQRTEGQSCTKIIENWEYAMAKFAYSAPVDISKVVQDCMDKGF